LEKEEGKIALVVQERLKVFGEGLLAVVVAGG
jgi:hypothetical protein